MRHPVKDKKDGVNEYWMMCLEMWKNLAYRKEVLAVLLPHEYKCLAAHIASFFHFINQVQYGFEASQRFQTLY